MNKQCSKNNILYVKLAEHEVDIILQALTDYMHGINAKYDFRKKPLTSDESLEKYFVKAVYEHILNDKIELREQIKKDKTILNKIIAAIRKRKGRKNFFIKHNIAQNQSFVEPIKSAEN